MRIEERAGAESCTGARDSCLMGHLKHLDKASTGQESMQSDSLLRA